MSTLLSLPTEVMIQIFESTAPDDIENLAFSCKRIYGSAGKIMEQHLKDKKTYANFSLHLTYWHGDPKCLPAYSKLRDLSKSRRLQLYPKFVSLENFGLEDHSRRQQAAQRNGVMDKVRCISDEVFHELESPYMHDNEIEFWHSKLAHGGIGVANCILLTFLPNVRSIFVWENRWFSGQMEDMVNRISRINDVATQETRESLSLQKLEEVTVMSQERSGRVAGYTGALEAFMSLPSLKIMRGRDLGLGFSNAKWNYPDHSSNVTQLRFRGCALAVDHLKFLLHRPKTLRIFSYDHCRNLEHYRQDYGPDKLMDSLHSCAENTLTFLNYTSDAVYNLPDHRKPRPGVLSKFKALKTLRISHGLLTEAETPRRPRRLVDELPPSLEELELVDPMTSERAQSMLTGMLATKREKLPNLRLIVFEKIIPLYIDQIISYARLGLVIDWRCNEAARLQKTGQTWLGGVECQRG